MKTTFFILLLLGFGLCSFGSDKKKDKEKLKPSKEKLAYLKDSAVIEFVGSAEVQKSISSKSDIPANAGIGLRYVRFFSEATKPLGIFKIEADVAISIASSVDTITALYDEGNNISNAYSFGNSILLPLNSGQSLVLNSKAYILNPLGRMVIFRNCGIDLNFSASNRVWKVQNSTRNASTINFNVGLFSEFVPESRMNDFSITVGLAWTNRIIIGDVGHHLSENFRRDVLGSSRKWYSGIEPNLSIRLKDIRATASIPILFSSQKNSVSGLTNGQFVTTIKFVGGFPLKL